MSGEEEIALHALAPGEEPDGALPRVIVLHALSGEYRVLLETERGLDVSGGAARFALPENENGDTREKAIAAARALAREHGLTCIFMREDA